MKLLMTDDLLAFFKVDNPKNHLEFVSANPTGPLQWVMEEELYLGMSKKFLKVQVMMFIANIM